MFNKAAPWTISTMGDFDRGGLPEGKTPRFAPRRFDVSHEISGALAPPNGEAIELDSVPQSPRNILQIYKIPSDCP